MSSKIRRYHLSANDPYARPWIDSENRLRLAASCGTVTFPDYIAEQAMLEEYRDNGMPICRKCEKRLAGVSAADGVGGMPSLHRDPNAELSQVVEGAIKGTAAFRFSHPNTNLLNHSDTTPLGYRVASKRHPHLRVSRRLPNFDNRKLTCVPAAVRNACELAGVFIPEIMLVDGKVAIGEMKHGGEPVRKNKTATRSSRYLHWLTEHSDVLSFKRFYDRGRQNKHGLYNVAVLKSVLEASESKVAVVWTTRPAHAWAACIDEDGELHILDNGGWYSGWQTWRGTNIEGIAVLHTEATGELNYTPLPAPETPTPETQQRPYTPVMQPGDRVRVTTHECPFPAYSEGAVRWNFYRTSPTVATYLGNGGTRRELRRDRRKGYIIIEAGQDGGTPSPDRPPRRDLLNRYVVRLVDDYYVIQRYDTNGKKVGAPFRYSTTYAGIVMAERPQSFLGQLLNNAIA